MSRYEHKPAVDEICKAIIAEGAVEVREWVAAHPEEPDTRQYFSDLTRRYYEAGADRCWLGEFQTTEEGYIDLQTIVVRMPKTLECRRQIYKLLCEHISEMSMCYDEPELHTEDPQRYFGEEFCLLRYD